MQGNSCTPLDLAAIQTRLPSAMSYSNYKYYGSPKENIVNIFEGPTIETRNVCSKE